jgi:hypothetical protein
MTTRNEHETRKEIPQHEISNTNQQRERNNESHTHTGVLAARAAQPTAQLAVEQIHNLAEEHVNHSSKRKTAEKKMQKAITTTLLHKTAEKKMRKAIRNATCVHSNQTKLTCGCAPSAPPNWLRPALVPRRLQKEQLLWQMLSRDEVRGREDGKESLQTRTALHGRTDCQCRINQLDSTSRANIPKVESMTQAETEDGTIKSINLQLFLWKRDC